MARIHWLGAGLSSAPGLHRLINLGYDLWLWNRDLNKAQTLLQPLGAEQLAQVLDWDALATQVTAGDVLVSMLPGNFHVQVAELAIAKSAHFVSSSYISPELQALHSRAQAVDVCLVNEVGLDPGIDHLMAHALVQDYKQSVAYKENNHIEFCSYCGGLPAQMNDFTYKFSWSPLGVLKALKSPAQWIDESIIKQGNKPWQSVNRYQAPLSDGRHEVFEAYPNRDSLPFMSHYHFEDTWSVDRFVRGTLRGDGWTQAWQPIFAQIEQLTTISDAESEQVLTNLSEDLWQKYAYKTNEQDRVVLVVELQVKAPVTKQPVDSEIATSETVWHQSYSLDAYGNKHSNAMARLVSNTVSLAIQAVLNQEVERGVTMAPSNRHLIDQWFDFIAAQGDAIVRQDHLL